MRECPNCGNRSYHTMSEGCGCTWDEIAQAERIKERRRRRELEKEGRPVLVDNLKRYVKYIVILFMVASGSIQTPPAAADEFSYLAELKEDFKGKQRGQFEARMKANDMPVTIKRIGNQAHIYRVTVTTMRSEEDTTAFIKLCVLFKGVMCTDVKIDDREYRYIAVFDGDKWKEEFKERMAFYESDYTLEKLHQEVDIYRIVITTKNTSPSDVRSEIYGTKDCVWIKWLKPDPPLPPEPEIVKEAGK